MHTRHWVLFVFLAVGLCTGLAGCASAAGLPRPTATSPAAPPTPTTLATLTTNSTQNRTTAPDIQKISGRLQTLMNDPALANASQDEQSKAFSLPPSGAGSIRFDKQGRVLVNIRVNDASDGTVQTIKDAGALVQHVSAQYLTLSAYVSAQDLAAVAALAPVLSLQEELAPQMHGGNGS